MNIGGNGSPLFSQINFDQTYFGAFLSRGILARVFCPGAFCPVVCVRGVYVLEP